MPCRRISTYLASGQNVMVHWGVDTPEPTEERIWFGKLTPRQREEALREDRDRLRAEVAEFRQREAANTLYRERAAETGREYQNEVETERTIEAHLGEAARKEYDQMKQQVAILQQEVNRLHRFREEQQEQGEV